MDAAGRLGSLREVVLLGGSVRPSRLGTAIGRPAFSLPVSSEFSILALWRREVAEFAEALGQSPLPVRLMIDRGSAEPEMAPSAIAGLSPLQLDRDPLEFRGTGGVLRDLSEQFRPADLLLVGNAAQILLRPLKDAVTRLAAADADVAVAAHDDGTPSGLMLVRCSALAAIPDAGFVDMKEQALPMIASGHRVAAARFGDPTGFPVRSLGDYIEGLRRYHLRRAGKRSDADPFSENLASAFHVVEPGAAVDPAARLHDSVVLAGGAVDAGAALVQSVVCADGHVRRREVIVDSLVTAPGRNGRGGEIRHE